MSNQKPNQKNIFLSKYRRHSFRKNNSSTNISMDPNANDAQKWLEKFRPDMQSINKQDVKTTLPRFVQDFIYVVWHTENEEVYEKPQKNQAQISTQTRWKQIKEEIFEGEEQRRQENTFKMSRNNDRNNRDRPASRFRPCSYKPKPKKKKIFDLAKETANDGFPTLN